MSESKIIKKYKKGELTIIWKPKKCIHAAICVHTLPKVYDPNAKPWIQPDHASINELIDQIDKCPSGALLYEMDKKDNNIIDMETNIDIMSKGPLLIQGALRIKMADGTIEIKNKTTAFCRCGASANKPYCDGAHKKIVFDA